MSKESLDYQKLCSNYYSSWEEGCCMESCEFYNHNECPVVYVNGLLEERDKTIADLKHQLALTEKALELACKELRDDMCLSCPQSHNCNRFEMCEYVLSTHPSSYYIELAKEMMKSE